MKTILTMSQIQARVREVFSASRILGLTSAEECARVKTQIWDELARKHGARPVYSRYLQGYAQGLIDAERAANYAQHLEYCYLQDGILFSTHADSAHRKTEEFYSAGRGCELGKLPSGHYWKKSAKPYFIGGTV